MAKDDHLKARIVAKLHGKGFYSPRGVDVENAASFGIKTSDRGRAKELVHEMARDDSCPVIYKVTGEAVMLDQQSEEWAASWIRRFDESEVPWNLQNR